MMKFEFYKEGIGADQIVSSFIGRADLPGVEHLASLDMIFGIRCPSASKLLMVGAIVDGVGVTGTGRTWQTAVSRLIGETAEFRASNNTFVKAETLTARDFDSGATVKLLKPFVYDLSATLSEGCAAGLSNEAAEVHGVLELIERNVTSRWWRGLLKGSRVVASEGFLNQFRSFGDESLVTELIGFEDPYGVTTVVALSYDSSGRMFSCGSAADTFLRRAAGRALRELHQMESGHHLIRDKLSTHRVEALSHGERLTIQRASMIDCRDLVAESVEGQPQFLEDSNGPPVDYDFLRRALTKSNADCSVIELEDPYGVQVVKVVSRTLSRFRLLDVREEYDPRVEVGLLSAKGLPLM